MYRLTLTLARDHTERTGWDTRRRQARKITLKALVSAQAWDWDSTFELTDPIEIERGWQLPVKVVYTFVGGKDPGEKRIEQDKDAILREMERIGKFDSWKGKHWHYSGVKLERVGERDDEPTPEGPVHAAGVTAVPDLSDFEYQYQVTAALRSVH